MSYKIVLQPGELNDANRDYLPKAIKGSRMVVNENGNNSQVYPARLTEYVEDILGDGIRDVWYEYVPESYDSGKKTPLVFSMHGGLMTGWGQCIYTSWSLVAEKEGFLCVFPNASANKMWMIECDDEKMDEITTSEKLAGSGVPALNRPTGSVPEFHDVRLVMKLLEDKLPLQHITVMVQKEVADRMQTGPGSKDYGALSLAVQYYAKPYIVANVPPNCFMPRPAVGSAVIRLTRHEKPPVSVRDPQFMFKLIRASFNQRRKTLQNGLHNSGELQIPKEKVVQALEQMGLPTSVRGEKLDLSQFARLSDLLME